MPVGFVVGVVAFEPDYLTVAFKGEHVRGDAVQEPAVVRDDHDAAGEVEDGFFKGAQGFDVEIVGRLVEQQQVAAFLQQFGEVQAVAFAAGQILDPFLLVGALEVEATQVGARVHFVFADGDDVHAVGDFLPNCFATVQAVARLIDIGQFHGLAETQFAAVGLFLFGDHAEQRGLAGAVRTDHADDAAARQGEGQIVDQQSLAIGFADLRRLDDQITEPRAGRDIQFLGLAALLVFLRGQFLEARQARLALGVSSLGRGAHPFQFGLDGALPRDFLLLLHRQALVLLLQPGGVIAFPGYAVAAIQFQNPAGDVVEKIAIMRDGDHSAWVFF